MASRKVPSVDWLHDSIARIYDAALDTSLWPSVLAELCDHATAAACHIFVYDRESGDVPFTTVGQLPPEAEEEYLQAGLIRNLLLEAVEFRGESDDET